MTSSMRSELPRPSVSYVVASYNHRPYVQQCIDSILGQTYGAVELIVIDDGSRDGTREFLRSYSQVRGFRYEENSENMGAARTFNKGLALSTGDYVGILASDDWLDPTKVKKQVAFLESTELDVVLGPVIQFQQETGASRLGDLRHLTRTFAQGAYLRHLYQTDANSALIQSGLFRGDPLRSIGFHTNYKSDDWLLMIRLLQAGYRAGLLNEPLTYYRLHGANSHRNAEYCLEHLQMPVVRDFIPEEFHSRILSSIYHTASTKLIAHERRRSLKLQLDSIRQDLNPWQIATYLALLVASLPGGESPFRAAQRTVRWVRAQRTGGQR